MLRATHWRACAVTLALLAGAASAYGDDHTPANPDAGSLLDDKGCKFVNPHPKPEETVSWSGGCVDGWAEGDGTAQWFTKGQPGQRYVGTMARGLYEGHGVLHIVEGGDFDGNFARGLLQGKASVQWPNGNRYEGEFVDGERTGRGVFTWSAGSRYEGDFVKGERTGHGLYRSADGATYDGEFLKGRFNGHGVQRRTDGSIFEGEFAGGRAVGHGVLRTPDGQTKQVDLPLGPERPHEVCTKLASPQMPEVGKWSGTATYEAQADVRSGRVVAIEVKVRQTAGDRDIDRTLIRSVVAALNQYECPGDHFMSQLFMFRHQ